MKKLLNTFGGEQRTMQSFKILSFIIKISNHACTRQSIRGLAFVLRSTRKPRIKLGGAGADGNADRDVGRSAPGTKRRC
jgi:hypothetical protein